MRLNNLTELIYCQDYIIESMKYGAVYQLCFWIQFYIKTMMLWGFQLIPTLGKSANSLSVPVMGPIPLPPLD